MSAQSRRQIIENRQAIAAEVDSKHVGNGGQQFRTATQCGASSARGVSNTSKRGGKGSARTDEHGGSERRRRPSKSVVVGGGLGTDSSEDKGAGRKQVRFDVASSSFDVAGRLNNRCCDSFADNGIGECCGNGDMFCSHPSVCDLSIPDIEPDLDCATDINNATYIYIYIYVFVYLSIFICITP